MPIATDKKKRILPTTPAQVALDQSRQASLKHIRQARADKAAGIKKPNQVRATTLLSIDPLLIFGEETASLP